MMDQRRLIVFTNSFPTGVSETFFANELPYLAASFREVHLVPLEKVSDKSAVSLPENVITHLPDLNLTKGQKLLAVLSVFKKQVLKEVGIALKRKSAVSLGVKIATIMISWKRAGMIAGKAKEMFRTDGSDIFYAYWADDSAVGLARLKSQFPEIKAVARAHRWDLYFYAMTDGYLPFRSFIAYSLDILFPISEMGAEYIRDNWPGEKQNIIISRLGVNNRSGNMNPVSINEHKTIVSISSLAAVKRLPFLIDVLSQVRNVKLAWIHFGGGAQLDELISLARTKLEGKVQYHFKGHTQNEELVQWLETNHVDALINVSSSEGIPVSIMEAYSREIPAIATAVGGTPEIVDNSNGLLIDVNAPATDIAEQVGKFLNSENLSLKGKAAFQMWEQKFNADKNYPEFIRQLKN